MTRALDATAFLNEHYGLVFNGMITVNFGQAGLRGDRETAKALTHLNEALASHFANNCARFWLESYTHHYLYAHEWVKSYGHHVHEVVSLPRGADAYIGGWLQKWLERYCGRPVDPRAIKYEGRFYPKRAKAIEQQAHFVTYILKCAVDAHVQGPHGGSLHEMLRIEGENHYYAANVARAVGISQKLNRQARRRAGYQLLPDLRSALTDESLRRFDARRTAQALEAQLAAIEV